MKILIVDDARAVHSFVKGLLAESGHDFTSAFNGKEAVEELEKDNSFELVLLDWEMPVMNGLEALEKIRANGFTGVILMVTSKNDITDIAQSLEKGANEYVIKPFTKEILEQKLELARAEGGI